MTRQRRDRVRRFGGEVESLATSCRAGLVQDCAAEATRSSVCLCVGHQRQRQSKSEDSGVVGAVLYLSTVICTVGPTDVMRRAHFD